MATTRTTTRKRRPPRKARTVRPVAFTAAAERALAENHDDAFPEKLVRALGTSRKSQARVTGGTAPTGTLLRYKFLGLRIIATFDAEEGFVVYSLQPEAPPTSRKALLSIIDPTSILD